MYKLTPADFADTGQWRLLIVIKDDGLSASLENTLHVDVPFQHLCSVKWDDDKEAFIKNLENAVFDNPRLLDDFATRILFYDKKTLFMPSKFPEENEDFDIECYNDIYKIEPGDLMSETHKEITCLWSMAPGVKKFILRNFPGARVTNHLFEEFKDSVRNNPNAHIKLIKRPDEFDLIFTNGKKLISASTHSFTSSSQIYSLIEDAINIYGFEKNQVTIEEKNEFAENGI